MAACLCTKGSNGRDNMPHSQLPNSSTKDGSNRTFYQPNAQIQLQLSDAKNNTHHFHFKRLHSSFVVSRKLETVSATMVRYGGSSAESTSINSTFVLTYSRSRRNKRRPNFFLSNIINQPITSWLHVAVFLHVCLRLRLSRRRRIRGPSRPLLNPSISSSQNLTR